MKASLGLGLRARDALGQDRVVLVGRSPHPGSLLAERIGLGTERTRRLGMRSRCVCRRLLAGLERSLQHAWLKRAMTEQSTCRAELAVAS